MRPKADMNIRLLHYDGLRPRPTWVLKLTSDAAEGRHEKMKLSLRRPSATSDADVQPKVTVAA